MEADKGAQVAAVACRNTLVVAAAAAAGLGAVAPLAVPIVFGDAFSPAIRAIFWLIPGIIALSGAKVLSSYIFSQGRMAVTSLVALVTLAGTVMFDLLLIPRFGISGAAAASSIAYSVSFTLTLLYYRRLSGNSVLDCLVVRGADLKLYMDLAKKARQRIVGHAIAGSQGTG
jgi:O-antigen/teichoic acid export membrane protein